MVLKTILPKSYESVQKRKSVPLIMLAASIRLPLARKQGPRTRQQRVLVMKEYQFPLKQVMKGPYSPGSTQKQVRFNFITHLVVNQTYVLR